MGDARRTVTKVHGARALAGAAAGGALLLAAGAARAQYPAYLLQRPAAWGPPTLASEVHPDSPAGVARRWADRRGAEYAFHVGAASFTNSSDPAFQLLAEEGGRRTGPGAAGTLAIGYRFVPWMSAGARAYYQFTPGAGVPAPALGGQTDIVTAGAYARFYLGSALGWRHFEPWASVGVDPWAVVMVTTRFARSPVVVSTYSVSIPVSVGFDYNITPEWSVGILGQGGAWFPWARCGDVVESQNARGCRDAGGETAFSFFGGAGMRWLLPRW